MVLWRAPARPRAIQTPREATAPITREVSGVIHRETLDQAVRRFPYRVSKCRRATDDQRRTIMQPVYEAICLEYRAILMEKSRYGR